LFSPKSAIRRHGLADRQQPDLPGLAAGAPAGIRDPRAHGGEPVGDQLRLVGLRPRRQGVIHGAQLLPPPAGRGADWSSVFGHDDE
jgi:hypothetical protein